MNCQDVQSQIALENGEENLVRMGIRAHLDECPLCRVGLYEHRDLKSQLKLLVRPKLSLVNDRAIRSSISHELRTGKVRTKWLSTGFGEWAQMRLMPFAAGTVATLIVGLGVLSFLFSTFNDPIVQQSDRTSNVYRDTKLMIAEGRAPEINGDAIFPADYARNRLAVANDSPSLNPQGSLVSLTGSTKLDRATSDGVVVVAEVFSDGLAKIQEVVSPGGTSREIEDLEKAMDAELGDAPFVPASLDGRSNSVRVVLRFEHVDVHIKTSRKRKP